MLLKFVKARLQEPKSGVEPDGCVELVKHVASNCSNLEFCGLMTIGMPDYTSTPENFKTLARCRSEVCKALGISEDQCELSMGMSGDLELAVENVQPLASSTVLSQLYTLSKLCTHPINIILMLITGVCEWPYALITTAFSAD